MKARRSDAIAAGDRFYNTGKKCMRGHLSKRITMDGSCVQCRYDYQKSERDRIRKIANVG